MANLRLPSNYSSVHGEHLSVTLPRNLTREASGAALLPPPLPPLLCRGGRLSGGDVNYDEKSTVIGLNEVRHCPMCV